MKTSLIIIVVVLVLAGLCVLYAKQRHRQAQPSTVKGENDNFVRKSELTGKMVVDSLEEMGYFRFTDAGNLPELKKEIAEGFDEYSFLSSTFDETPPFGPRCNRKYHCDGETLFEIGGLEEMLNSVKPTFDKLNVPLTWKDEYWNDDATLHTIVLNGKKYTAYEGVPTDNYAWGHATKNFVNILNDQLALHNSDERVYPIMYGNDGRIIFLTQRQFDFIQRHFTAEMPRTVEVWWEEGTR